MTDQFLTGRIVIAGGSGFKTLWMKYSVFKKLIKGDINGKLFSLQEFGQSESQ